MTTPPEKIGNAVENPVFSEMPANTTTDKKGSQ
jgi:hypothetical protein